MNTTANEQHSVPERLLEGTQTSPLSVASIGTMEVSVEDALEELLDLHDKLMIDFPPSADDTRSRVESNHKTRLVASAKPAPKPARRPFQTRVLLALTPLAHNSTIRPASCAVENTSLVFRFEGSSTGVETQHQIKMPIARLTVQPVADGPGISVRVQGGTAGIFIYLESQAKRDALLSAIHSFINQ